MYIQQKVSSAKSIFSKITIYIQQKTIFGLRYIQRKVYSDKKRKYIQQKAYSAKSIHP